MHIAKDSAPAGIRHRASDAHRNLPRLAARLLYTKDEEEMGLGHALQERPARLVSDTRQNATRTPALALSV